jgi:hypothetical protein
LSVASPVEILLYMYNLLTTLPLYFPKQTIKFMCELREETQKVIELTNPSNKEVNYWAKIITIQPKQTVEVKITYTCRFFKSAEAKLCFIQKQEDDIKNRVSPVVFALKTEVMGKTLSKTVCFDANQYEMMVFNVEVESPFSNPDYPFEVAVSLLDEEKKDKKNFLQSFFLTSSKLKLYKSKDSKLELKFLAMTYESKSCKISFFEPMRG